MFLLFASAPLSVVTAAARRSEAHPFANAVTGFTWRTQWRPVCFLLLHQRRSSGAKKKPNCCSSCLTQYSVSVCASFFFLTEIKSLNADHNYRRSSFF